MKFTELKLKGSYLIELEPFIDERGTFARHFCKRELKKQGIDFEVCQCNFSQNIKAGTLRGMHYQKAPNLEAKMVSCLKGSFFDVIVDLRKDSKTYLKHETFILKEGDNKVIYIPENFAHGFQTLEDDTTVYYQLANYFVPKAYAGLRWDDPKLDINWPDCENRITSDKDCSYELLK
jgi:dTDP-4-dehydrorhamnose 3,5-epimerase